MYNDTLYINKYTYVGWNFCQMLNKPFNNCEDFGKILPK